MHLALLKDCLTRFRLAVHATLALEALVPKEETNLHPHWVDCRLGRFHSQTIVSEEVSEQILHFRHHLPEAPSRSAKEQGVAETWLRRGWTTRSSWLEVSRFEVDPGVNFAANALMWNLLAKKTRLAIATRVMRGWNNVMFVMRALDAQCHSPNTQRNQRQMNMHFKWRLRKSAWGWKLSKSLSWGARGVWEAKSLCLTNGVPISNYWDKHRAKNNFSERRCLALIFVKLKIELWVIVCSVKFYMALIVINVGAHLFS